MNALICFILLTSCTTTACGWSLKTYDFTGRDLTHVPTHNITPDTHTLKLSDNDITDLGSFNTTYNNLRFLFISNNKVKEISPLTFRGLRELVLLDLDQNYVDSLHDFIFSTLESLTDLVLSNNLISVVSENAFCGLASLEFLELSGNRISVFPVQAFKLIPSKDLKLVLLRANNISKMYATRLAHPNTTFDVQGNPLQCPDGPICVADYNSEHTPTIREDNGVRLSVYTMIHTAHSRPFIKKAVFIKSRYKYMGVLPLMLCVLENIPIRLPAPAGSLPASSSFYWNTPRGCYGLKSIRDSYVIKNFTAKDAGVYSLVADRGSVKLKYDLVLCTIQHPDKKSKRKRPKTENVPVKNNTDICLRSKNQSSVSSESLDRELCARGNVTSETDKTHKPNTVFIISVTVTAVLSMVCLGAIVFWMKHRQASRDNSHAAASASVRVGLQAMVVAISVDNVDNPNTGLSRYLQGTEAAQSTTGPQCAAEPATAGLTQAEVHHYCKDDTSTHSEDPSDDGEVLKHQYASAAPPPEPLYDDNDDDTSLHSDDLVDGEVLNHQYDSAAPPPVPVYDDNGDTLDTRQQWSLPKLLKTMTLSLAWGQLSVVSAGSLMSLGTTEVAGDINREHAKDGTQATVYQGDQGVDEGHSRSSLNPEPTYGANETSSPARNTLYEQQPHCVLYGRGPAAQ
ncbi:hypothetical protein Bbelb_236460 [Branchiostoma belcheri]|nr:hypothetical protein Bbelb_236460 [Branchiostoma belcheri]